MAVEPQVAAWIIPGRLAIAERPGGGGRSHRILRREHELEWWADQGIDTIISGMRTRHGLLEAALCGFRVMWFPLTGPEQAARTLPEIVDCVGAILDDPARAVLVHVDRPGEWLAAVDVALRLNVGVADTLADAVVQTTGDGLPFGEISARILGLDSVDVPALVGAQSLGRAA